MRPGRSRFTESLGLLVLHPPNYSHTQDRFPAAAGGLKSGILRQLDAQLDAHRKIVATKPMAIAACFQPALPLTASAFRIATMQVSSCTQAFNLVLLWVGASAPFELPSLMLAVIIS